MNIIIKLNKITLKKAGFIQKGFIPERYNDYECHDDWWVYNRTENGDHFFTVRNQHRIIRVTYDCIVFFYDHYDKKPFLEVNCKDPVDVRISINKTYFAVTHGFLSGFPEMIIKGRYLDNTICDIRDTKIGSDFSFLTGDLRI